jgi:hypothetical protein
VVSARVCANQFLPCNSSGIATFGMKTVQADSCLNSEQIDTLFIGVGGQADSCLNSEQIDTLFISVGGHEGGWGGVVILWAGGPKFTQVCQEKNIEPSCLQSPTFQKAVLQPGAMCLIFSLDLHSVLQLCLPNTNFCSPATTADQSVLRKLRGPPGSRQASPSAGHASHACLCTSGKSNEINYVLLFL